MVESVARLGSGEKWFSLNLIQHSFTDGSYRADGSPKEEAFSGSLWEKTGDWKDA